VKVPVLIVDDSMTVRMDLVDAFERAGFAPVACATAADARAALQRGSFRAVVLDVVLPDGDGVQLLREVRAMPGGEQTPVLLLSTEAEVRDRLRGLKTGADEYVGKPYDADGLAGKTRALLREPAAPPPNAQTVLVIDDSPTYRHVVCAALEEAGYAVASAASGEEGLRLAARLRPHAVIVDGYMPGIDGATVIRRLRLDVVLRGVACVLLTGSDEVGAELRALDAGADAFVRKEEDTSVVLARLAAVLRGSSSGPAAASGAASTLESKKVLVIDDDPAALHDLAAALRGDGHDVIPGRSGGEALELLALQPVDCVVLSATMAGLDGVDTCRRIKGAPVTRDVPLILLTPPLDREAVLAGLAAGADDCVPGANDQAVLRARVRAQIRRKQVEDENRRVRLDLLQRELQESEARAARVLADTRARLIEELERKNDELDAFAHSVSHDLRAPLRGIQGFAAALAEEYLEKLDEPGRHYLTRLRAAAQRMDDLIVDMLRLSRVGRLDLAPAPVDLSRLAAEAAAELRQREPERAVDLAIEPDLIARADASLMRIVFDNLLGNAWKFTARAPAARIAFGAVPGAEWTYFVRDNGAGFDMSRADRLFRPFQRLHSGAEFTGTGVGLATVARIVDRHGGRVWAEGTVGGGATFYFTIGAG
jgi:two-component system NtrC family sensor kinase